MSETYQRSAHSSWYCKYHVVFVPKRRRKVLVGQARRKLGEVFHAVARQKECQIMEGHLLPDLNLWRHFRSHVQAILRRSRMESE